MEKGQNPLQEEINSDFLNNGTALMCYRNFVNEKRKYLFIHTHTHTQVSVLLVLVVQGKVLCQPEGTEPCMAVCECKH